MEILINFMDQITKQALSSKSAKTCNQYCTEKIRNPLFLVISKINEVTHFKITPHEHIYDFIFKNNTCSFASRACALPTYTMPTVINVPLFFDLDPDFNCEP